MSMFYSSHGDKAWAVKFVAAKRNNFWTKSSFSASIEGDALVSWQWFSIRFQSELAALGFELLFKRPSPFPLFGAAAMVGLLNIYKKLLRDSFVSRSVNALVLVWQNEACSGSWQTLLPSFLLCLLCVLSHDTDLSSKYSCTCTTTVVSRLAWFLRNSDLVGPGVWQTTLITLFKKLRLESLFSCSAAWLN